MIVTLFGNFTKSLKVSLHQLTSKTNDLVFFIKDYLKAQKLFPVACRYGWHGWKWIET